MCVTYGSSLPLSSNEYYTVGKFLFMWCEYSEYSILCMCECVCLCVSGQILELLGEQEDNEHWWRVRDEDGNEGCVPASYVIKRKENQVKKNLQ